jgi:uncharacterized protein (TIGR03437 family)
VRPNRWLSRSLPIPLLFGMGVELRAQQCNLTVTLSATSNSLSAGETTTLQALVSPCATDKQVRFDFSPAVTGAVVGTAAGPNAGGLTTITYTAPPVIATTTRVTVTATSLIDNTKSDTVTLTLAPPAIDVGSGAPNPTIQNQFITSFFRNGFSNLVSLPPLAGVRRSGTTGYVQEFNDAAKSGAKLALATASPTAPSTGSGGVVQLLAELYAYYTTVGATTAGLPLYDTLGCPAMADNSCTYDIFDKGYALFAYHVSLPAGQNFTVRNTFYTEWTARGGIGGLGRPIDAETAVTASTATTATSQAFLGGAIFTISSGANNGKTFTVAVPIYDLYNTLGGPVGSLGVPVSAEITLSSGVHRQTFEGGILEYTPGNNPVQRVPVASVAVSGVQGGSAITLNLGDSLTLTATPMSLAGTALEDRPVTWTTSNSRVISIEASGRTAVLRASGGGVATVTAVSEGALSPRLSFIVVAPCCQVGDGAPAAVQRSFQDALTRNRISVQLPVAGPALRVGGGYVQTVQSSDGSAYFVAQSDKIASAYVIGGLILEKYDSLGGPAGSLGYPVTDRSAGGTQRFENSAALAGSPVRLVTGGVLAKWGLLGYETGAAGAPAGDAAAFATFGANSGSAQPFGGGSIYSGTAGPRSGQNYFVSGLVLARYNALGGAGGDFGMPASDEFVTGGVHQQNFEGGNITWSAGDIVAKEHAVAKTPGVTASPSTLIAGGRTRLAIVGFASGATLKVSVTGQPDFTVTTANGAYSWDLFFPLTTHSGSITIQASDARSAASARGSVTVKGFNDNRIAMAKVQGDNQTGIPGALLPLALRVALRGSAGDPVSGVSVTFEASSGAAVLSAAAVTDATGLAETYVRLQPQEGVALVRVDAPGVASAPVTFGVRSAASSLSNFPKMQQAGTATLGNGTGTIAQRGALLTAVASILRYHQNRSELPGPNGSADPAALNAFLKSACATDSKGVATCDGFLSNPDSGEQVVNLWRAADFAGGADVEVADPTLSAIADLLARGSPVLVSLGLSRNGTVSGGHSVVAIGIAADGSILIQDPNPAFARAKLNEYLNGFSLGADQWKADLRGVARFSLGSPPGTRFLAAAISQPEALMSALALNVISAAGTCGRAFGLLDATDGSGGNPPKGALVSRMTVCDGSQSTYQVRVGATQSFRALVDDLAAGGLLTDLSGSVPGTYQLTRPKLNLTVLPQDINFTAGGVVNGATFAAGIAPGAIVSIFGSGLSGEGKATVVELDGTAVRVFFATPFQINAEIPLGTSIGTHTLRVQSAYGTWQQQVSVGAAAPGIFMVGNPPAAAITNTNYALIGASNPLSRGETLVIFATGLGAVRPNGNLFETVAPVTVLLDGVELSAFAAQAPGFPGLYQVNVVIPASTAPGSGLSLTLKVGGQTSNPVGLALQ